ncbi:FecR family protein [Dyadobacter fanqingshengii]|uniref:FecR family protein n=1 Tax=Dyadobacter fanqingshengii TaxID=2906443 RepID=A0A9X1T7L4_9BACT|nr:FecR family protein [Dyadobacter fanqingshengii]MCF0039185.1 FecR family protein [Dyadobacter fanqingshengii]USJ33996.1 FecR family protein [Dyadobacter fanqingshengii]
MKDEILHPFDMTHDPYSLTELIRSDEFIAWVMHPDALSDRKWQIFLENNPDKKQTVEAAREYVILLARDTGRDQPTKKQSERMWNAVESQMHSQSSEFSEIDEPATQARVVSGWRWIRVAASAALILGIGSVSYWFYYKQGLGRAGEVAAVEQNAYTGMVQRNNDTKKPMTILLADGSSVVLQPGGHLSYSEVANAKRREVTLTGKAFFEIVKNREKPFLVYTYGLATKVLGTSFMIDASEANKDIRVEVKTGTVSVFSINNLDKKEIDEESDKPALTGITLSQDQKIAFSKESGKIIKLDDHIKELAVDMDILKQGFVFDETPIHEVFRTLEHVYNVQISYDKVKMANCTLNATLIGQPFKEKLEAICNALDAQYEVNENQVSIIGKGCK